MFGKVGWFLLARLLFFSGDSTNVSGLERLSSVVEGDLGSRLTLQCNVSGQLRRILWEKDGQDLGPELSWNVYQHRGALVSASLLASDAGNYSCRLDTPRPRDRYSMRLLIRTPPARLCNVTVHPSTVVATVRWHLTRDGGYPITHFTLAYQAVHWTTHNGSLPGPRQDVQISPTARQFFVYHLEPGTLYMFRLWASNRLGPGEASTVYASTASPRDPSEVAQKMLAAGDDFSTAAWMVAVSMVMGTISVLSCISCLLIYKEGHNGDLMDGREDESVLAHVVANPGFEVDLEESYLLDHTDCNDNNQRAVRTNNNSVVRPSLV